MEIDPNDVTLVYDFAVFLQERKRDFDGAEAEYKKALKMAPTDSNVLNNYAVFLSVIPVFSLLTLSCARFATSIRKPLIAPGLVSREVTTSDIPLQGPRDVSTCEVLLK